MTATDEDAEPSHDVNSKWPKLWQDAHVAWPLGLSAVATVSGTLTGVTHGAYLAACIVLLLLGTFSALLVALARDHRAEFLEEKAAQKRDTARRESLALFDRQVTPLLENAVDLAACTTAPARRLLAGQLQTAVVVAAALTVGNGSVRANLFEKTVNVTSGDEIFVPTQFHGRGKKSTRVFTDADDTIRIARAGNYRFVPDANDPALGYETYLTMPIIVGTELRAVLTLDALHTGDLTRDDRYFVRVLAQIAALAFAAV